MLRGFATINYWAADLATVRDWYSELLWIEPYFERAELDGRIIGPDDPDYERARLGYVEFRIGDYQHELGLIDRRYAPGGSPPPSSTRSGMFSASCTTHTIWRSCGRRSRGERHRASGVGLDGASRLFQAPLDRMTPPEAGRATREGVHIGEVRAAGDASDGGGREACAGRR